MTILTILPLLPLPIGIILAIALMCNEINRRNEIHKSMVELKQIGKRYEE